MTNSADPDQLASSEANRSGSTLFAKQTQQIQISWLLQKPTDLDLHCLLRQGMLCSAREGLIYIVLSVTNVSEWTDSKYYLIFMSSVMEISGTGQGVKH